MDRRTIGARQIQFGLVPILMCAALSGCNQTPYMPPPRLVEYPEDDPKPAAPAASPAVSAAKSPAAVKPAVAVATAKPIAAAPAKELPIGRDEGDYTGPRTAVKPEFPIDFAEWLPDDFRAARKKRFPRLLQAVQALGLGNEFNPDADENARLLEELLQPLPASVPATAPKRASVGYDDDDPPAETSATALPGLPKAIVATLGVNGSAAARGTLKRILLGNEKSDLDDRQLTIAALQTLIDHLDAENERILLAVLTVPNSIRPPGHGQLTADQLQEECLRLMRPVATAEFRLHLAQRMARGVSSATCRERLLAQLSSIDRKNLPAQVELSISGHLEPSWQTAVDRQLGQWTQQVLERLIKASPTDWNQVAASANNQRADETHGQQDVSLEEVVENARQLFRADFAGAIAQRIAACDPQHPDPDFVKLVTSLPDDSVRRALAHAWKESWAELSTGIHGATLVAGVRDPGLLVVLKLLPRESPMVNIRNSARNYPDTPQGQRLAKADAAKKVWLQDSEKIAKALVDRCQKIAEEGQAVRGLAGPVAAVKSVDEFDKLLDSSATTSSIAANSSPDESSLGEFGIRLHKGARIGFTYGLHWPADFQNRLPSGGGSLAVFCMRVESESDLETVANHYAKQLKAASIRSNDQGRWIDALIKLDGQRLRSVDVFIKRADGDTEVPRRGVVSRLTTDVLCVETLDPLADSPPSDEPRNTPTATSLRREGP